MPLIKGKTPHLAAEGPRVGLVIARPEMLPIPEGETPYHRTDVNALIDTGADFCGIRNSLAAEMSLQAVDFQWFGNSSGGEYHAIYLVDMIFYEDGLRRPTRVAGCNFSRSVEFLIGRHFLATARFAYDGIAGTYELEFE